MTTVTNNKNFKPKLTFASTNLNKLDEIKQILGNEFNIECAPIDRMCFIKQTKTPPSNSEIIHVYS
jgi:inosine/xanthosine triphosphate pyrophosphatase family protein